MVPDVLVPAEAIGCDGAPILLCWICAHLVTEHEVELGVDGLGAHKMCACPRERVFPERSWSDTAPVVNEDDLRNALELARVHQQVIDARIALTKAEQARDQKLGVRTVRVPARERQAQARAAAGLTAAARRAAGR